MMHRACDVANFFIQLAVQGDGDLQTNLKVNKLLYYAQGHSLARFGKPLFSENIEAWRYGPVIPSIYDKYKVCGRDGIEVVDDSFNVDVFSDEELSLLLDVAREYGQYTGERLRDMTHREAPWRNVYDPGMNAVITQKSMQEFFASAPLRSFAQSLKETMKIDVKLGNFPKYYYCPEEDAIWGE